jgi:hypothetical protein
MDRRTRICLWVILIGLANFLAYAILYFFFDGDAINGSVLRAADGTWSYFLRSPRGADTPVSRTVFLYSGIHSISIWLTVAAIMLAMLTLAKDRIVSSMHSTVVRGRTMITILATVITLTTLVIAIWFALVFASRVNRNKFARPHATQPVAPMTTWN